MQPFGIIGIGTDIHIHVYPSQLNEMSNLFLLRTVHKDSADNSAPGTIFVPLTVHSSMNYPILGKISAISPMLSLERINGPVRGEILQKQKYAFFNVCAKASLSLNQVEIDAYSMMSLGFHNNTLVR